MDVLFEQSLIKMPGGLFLIGPQPMSEHVVWTSFKMRRDRIHNQHPVDEFVRIELVVIADGVELFGSHPDSVVPAPEDESFFSSGCAHVCHPHKIRNPHSQIRNCL